MKYNLFGKKTGLLASEMVLGAANFGTRKGYGASPEFAAQIFKIYQDGGGNFIDISFSHVPSCVVAAWQHLSALWVRICLLTEFV